MYGKWSIILLTEQRYVTFSNTSKKICLQSSVLEMKYWYFSTANFTLGQEAKGSVFVRTVCAKHACAYIGLWTVRLKIRIDTYNSGLVLI